MKTTLYHLKKGQRAIIKEINPDRVPLKLFEMGCLPEYEIQLLEVAPLQCPIYVNVNDSHIAIRREIAHYIEVEIV